MKVRWRSLGYIAVIFFLVMSSVGVNSTYQNNFSDGSSEKEISFSPSGGTNTDVSINLPKLAMVRNATLSVKGDKVTSSDSISYSTKRDFRKGKLDENLTLLDDGGLTLVQKKKLFQEKFDNYTYIDNSSTNASVHAGWGGMVTLGTDPSITSSYSGTSNRRYGSITVTHNYGNRPFGYVKIYNLYSSDGDSLRLIISGYDPSSGSWTTLYNKYWWRGWPSVPYEKTFNPVIYTQIKVSLQDTEGNDYVRYSYSFKVVGYNLTGRVVSKEVDDVDWEIYKALLTADVKTPSGTSLKFYLSADGGTNWEPVIQGNLITFKHPGSKLKWMAYLNSTSNSSTPEIHQVNISFMKKVEAKGVFISREVETEWSVISVKATWLAEIKPGTNVTVEFTNDGGNSWKTSENGKDISFSYELGRRFFRFRIILQSDGENNTKFRSISVTYTTGLYPRNVTIDVGDNGRIEWEYPGNLLDEQNIESDALVDELNSLIPHVGEGDVTIPINITVKVGGKIILRNLSIEYGLPPVLTKNIPDIEMEEDKKLEHAIDLENYFTDDYDDGKLTFEVWFQQDPTKVEATIDGKYLNLETKTENWTGEVSFLVKASDTEGLKTQSNIFKVIVKDTPDPPIIMPLGTRYLFEDNEFTMDVEVVDGDQNDEFTFSDDTELFDISSIGKIKFTPRQEDVGEHSVRITVKDKYGLEDTKELKLIINNTNDPPKIKEIDAQTCEEDKEYVFIVEVEDEDLPNYDSIIFELKNAPKGMKIDNSSGKITWTPTNDDVGEHYLIVIATDSKGVVAERKMKISVLNTNDPPSVEIIEPKDGSNFTNKDIIKFKCVAKDIDKGDKLEITWYDGDKKLNIGPSFETTLQPGKHDIKVVVSDKKEKAEDRISITVIEVEEEKPPSDDNKNEDDTTRPTDVEGVILGLNSALFFGLIGLVVALVVISISIMMYKKSKEKKKEEMMRREEEERKKKEEMSSFGGYSDNDFLIESEETSLPSVPLYGERYETHMRYDQYDTSEEQKHPESMEEEHK